MAITYTTNAEGEQVKVTTFSNGSITEELVRPALNVILHWSGMDFLRRFTQTERIAVRTLANTDPYVYDFWHLLDSAIASGTPIVANDPDVIAGLAYLSITPTGTPVLATGRSAEILA